MEDYNQLFNLQTKMCLLDQNLSYTRVSQSEPNDPLRNYHRNLGGQETII